MLHTEDILVLVHPGSCCGSANFNIGRAQAQGGREAIADELDDWRGAILVIDGGLSDELPDYPRLSNAIDHAIRKTQATGHIGERVSGGDEDDFNQVDAINAFVDRHGLSPAGARFHLTGAWFDAADGHGCVNAVMDALAARGFAVAVLDSALDLDACDTDPSPSEPSP